MIFTQKERAGQQHYSKLNWERAKSSPPEKNTIREKELLTLPSGNVAEGRCWSWWWWWWVRTSWVHVTLFRGTGVKHQKASLNRRPSAYTLGGLSSHPSPVTDTETDSQCKTRDGSSGWPSALLEISYFTGIFYRWTVVRNILQHYFGSGEDDE